MYLDNRIFNEMILGYSNNEAFTIYNLKLTGNNNKHLKKKVNNFIKEKLFNASN